MSRYEPEQPTEPPYYPPRRDFDDLVDEARDRESDEEDEDA